MLNTGCRMLDAGCWILVKKPQQSLVITAVSDFISRGEKTRTSDPYVPNVVR